VLFVLFFGVSLYYHSISDFFIYRLVRGIICFTFLGVILAYHRKKTESSLLLFLILYGISSFATMWYENNTLATLALALNFLSFVILIVVLLPKVDLKKMNAFLLFIFIITVIINGYLAYQLVQLIDDQILSRPNYLFILLSAMSTVIVAFMSLLYNHIFNTKATLVFTVFIFIMLFADVFRAVGYYDIAYGNFSVYIARGLLLLGLSILVHYTFMSKNKKERLNTPFLKSTKETSKDIKN